MIRYELNISLVRTLIVPVKIDDEHIRVSPIPPGIVGEPVIFTSKFYTLIEFKLNMISFQSMWLISIRCQYPSRNLIRIELFHIQ